MYQYFKGNGLSTNLNPSETYQGIIRERKAIFSLPKSTYLMKKKKYP